MAVFAVFLLQLTQTLAPAQEHAENVLTISGTRFLLNGKPFDYTGVSFFNAIYNTNFNRDSASRLEWLGKFGKYQINVLRVWCQWDNKRGFVDSGPQSTLYHSDGQLRTNHLATLKALLTDTDKAGFVVELVFFSQESWHDGVRLNPEASLKAVQALTRELQPWRNLTFQIWNEFTDEQTIPQIKAIKALDSKRLVTTSPGFAGHLGDPNLNNALDYLTPHTSRQNAGKTWEIAPRELAYLLARYRKPVVDDEPARNGTSNFGGPKEATTPYDHILHSYEVLKTGAYVTYHHDMFQTGYGTPAIPPSGIPDPEYSPYHKPVFDFLAVKKRFTPTAP
jgi:hypothetical protein